MGNRGGMEVSSQMGVSQVVAFPVTNRRAHIRRCAEILDGKHGAEANAYWRQECRQLANELLSIGCPEDDMRRQVMDFQNAVQMELMRRHQEMACSSA